MSNTQNEKNAKKSHGLPLGTLWTLVFIVTLIVGGSLAWYYSGKAVKGELDGLKTQSAGTIFNVGYTGYVRYDEIGTDEDTPWTTPEDGDIITYTMLDDFTLNTFDSVFGRNKYSQGFIRFKIVLDDIDTTSPPALTLTLTRLDKSKRESGKHYSSDVSFVSFAMPTKGSVLEEKSPSKVEAYTAAYELFGGSTATDTSAGTGGSSDTSGTGSTAASEKMYFDDTNVVTYSITDYADSLVEEDGRLVLYVMMEADYDSEKVVRYVQAISDYMQTLKLGETQTVKFVGDLTDMKITLTDGN